MKAATKRVFTADYRCEAVKLVTEQGVPLPIAAKQLDIAYQTLHHWVNLAKLGKLSGVDTKRITPVSQADAEISRLKKENAVLREERDILKKATAFFAKESR